MINLKKSTLDITNSFSWFFMDAFWMTDNLELSYACVVPTVISGFILIFKESETSAYMVAISAFLWAAMNSLWLVGETLEITNYLLVCKLLFAAGILSMGIALLLSSDLSKTLLSFRRFRFRNQFTD